MQKKTQKKAHDYAIELEGIIIDYQQGLLSREEYQKRFKEVFDKVHHHDPSNDMDNYDRAMRGI